MEVMRRSLVLFDRIMPRVAKRMSRVNYLATLSRSKSGSVSDDNQFSKLDWWREGGTMMTVLRSMNTLRIPLIYNSLLGYLPQATPTYHTPLPLHGYRILDVGCGAGFLSEPLAKLGAKVTGLDTSKEVVSVARRHANLDPEVSRRVEYRCQSLEEMIEEEGGVEFDCVIASEVVEHVTSDLSLFYHNLTTFTKPGGYIIMTTINRTLESYLTVIAGAELITGILPQGTHDWNNFKSPDEVKHGLELNNRTSVDWMHGMWFNPLTSQWAWSQSLQVNYALRAVKCSN